MSDSSNKPAASPDDVFEALLKQAAAVSEVTVAARRQNWAVGERLLGGRFCLLSRLGEGGMGVVYEAHDDARKGTVALKTLTRAGPASVYRLKNEFRVIADVDHPNLVKLHELFGEGDAWFFTMDLVRGQRFDRWVRPEGLLEEGRLRSGLGQLVRAMAAIHALGKLHRDLKPSNVLVDESGHVVVIDFGLAIDPEPGSVGHTLTEDGVSGTPGYMAPEQAAGRPATAASDFYALGAMLYEALSGRLPFEGRVGELLAQKQSVDAPGVLAVAPSAPASLASLCDALLARDPARRPDAAGIRAQLGVTEERALLARPCTEGELFFGREAELEVLRSAYRESLAGRAVVLLVSGESGMGKSVLVHRFLAELRRETCAAIVIGRCYERESVSFKGLDGLVDDLSRVLRRMGDDAVAVMPRDAFALARLFPVLARVPAVERSPQRSIADPRELRQRAYAAFSELLGRIRDRQPLVMHIDDAQWLDRESAAFLRALFVQHEPVAGLVILSRTREGADRHELLSGLGEAARANASFQVSSLDVGPLERDAARNLAERRLGTEAAALADAVAHEARGIPFFVSELARYTARRGGRGTLSQVSLSSAIEDHLTELSSESRRLLELIALAGCPLDIAVALEAASAEHADLDALRSAHLVRLGSGESMKQVECYHDRIRQAVAEGLGEVPRMVRYSWLTRALECASNADAELLARCLEGAGNLLAAAMAFERAADRAAGSGAFDRASSLYACALPLAQTAPSVHRGLGRKLADVLMRLGRATEAATAYERLALGAEQEGERLSLQHKAAEAWLAVGHLAQAEASFAALFRAAGASLPRGGRGSRLAVLAVNLGRRAVAVIASGHRHTQPARSLGCCELARSALTAPFSFLPEQADAIASRYLQDALDSGDPRHQMQALGHRACVEAQARGASAAASVAVRLSEAERIAHRLSDPAAMAFVHLQRGICEVYRLEPATARASFTRARAALDHAAGGPSVATALLIHDQRAAHDCGDLADLARTTPIAVQEAYARDNPWLAAMLTASGIGAWLRGDDAGGAREALAAAHARAAARSRLEWLDLFLLLAEAQVGAYAGDCAAVAGAFEAHWPALASSALLAGSSYARGLALAQRAALALGAACAARDSEAERSAHLERAATASRALRKLDAATAVQVDAGLALARGDRDRAIAMLRACVAAGRNGELRMRTAALRRRLGQLIGQDEGKALLAASQAFMNAQDVANHDAMAEMLCPGLRA
ncbi:MAG: serine/threonine-protein kinase PknK [Polyangiales bacterium]